MSIANRRSTRAGRCALVVVVVVTAAVSLAPDPASAYPTANVEVEGRGWGHGRGMGQYGAWGYALDYGWSSPRILDHFYRGTRSGTLGETGPPNPVIDVELTAERDRSGWVSAPSGVDVPGAGRAAAWFAVRVGAGTWDLYAGTTCFDAQSRSTNAANKTATIVNRVNFLPVRATTGSITTTDDLLRPCRGTRRFRGSMFLLDSQAPRLTSPFDTINATLLVNSLPVESYLKGVVPAEIGSSAPLEAQKAQAVAARSFAAHPGRDRPGAAKLVDSVLDQVYRGFDAETAVTNSAIDATAGLIRRFTSNGAAAITEYSSSSGGYTAGGTYPAVADLGDDAFTCTGGAANILVGETTPDGTGVVRPPACRAGSTRVQLNARHRWRASVPVSAVESSYGVSGLQQVRPDTRTGQGEWGGRVLDLTIVAASGTRSSTGAEFSSRFTSYGVFSRWFVILGQRSPQPPTAAARGYWFAGADGGIFPYGDARWHGHAAGQPLNQPIVGMAATSTGLGYWQVAGDGGIFPFGDAGGYGSTGAIKLNQPIVGMAATKSGLGYWLVAADGGIFPFGDAGGYGSTGAMKLNQPIVGMARSASGNGYWLVAADGGIFPFGDAPGIGSLGAIKLNQPITAMASTPQGDGYWLLGADGGIFPFGTAPGIGSLPGRGITATARGMIGTTTGQGYLIATEQGQVVEFGDAPWLGEPATQLPGYASGSRGIARFGG